MNELQGEFNNTLLFNVTTASTSAPSSSGSMSDGNSDVSYADKDVFFLVLWVLSLLLFLSLPCCITERRRNLCWRRIRERRWIEDEAHDAWYMAAMRRQQQERRQRLEEEQRRFQTTRTQEDEIREQYLLLLMEKYTMVRLK
jgi:hypothetical protein